jgi:hypothetical protein
MLKKKLKTSREIGVMIRKRRKELGISQETLTEKQAQCGKHSTNCRCIICVCLVFPREW